MILAPDSEISKKALEETKGLEKPVHEDTPPPSYTVSESSTSTLSNPPVPNIQPCNFVSVLRKDSRIKGTWLLDPALSIPSDLLPPLPEGESERTRKNLSLQTKDGSIKATIFILPTTSEVLRLMEDRMPLRTVIDTSTKDGHVTIRIHEVPSQTDRRIPIQLRSYSGDGNFRVYLPRSFRGVFRIKTKGGRIRFSNAVESSLTPFSEVNGLQISFLGPLDLSEWRPEMDWNGDELILETKDGSANVYFDDEENAVPQTQKGFLKRIFKP